VLRCPLAVVAFGLTFGIGATPGAAQTITVAAASDLQAVMPMLARGFQQATGDLVKVTLGSSGNFFSQIQNGAPFDVFLSADIGYPRQLEAEGRVERGSLVRYARGRIVLWARSDARVDATRGLQVLTDTQVRRVAIANPDHAPYGRAAVAALRHVGLYERVQPKLVLGENVSQAAQFADSGNADIAILPQSLALTLAQRGRVGEIPDAYYPPIDQAGAVVASSANKAAAHQFLAFLQTPEIVHLMATHGFARPLPAAHAP
jgi:molybdate transport system substrate-binding protein